MRYVLRTEKLCTYTQFESSFTRISIGSFIQRAKKPPYLSIITAAQTRSLAASPTLGIVLLMFSRRGVPQG